MKSEKRFSTYTSIFIVVTNIVVRAQGITGNDEHHACRTNKKTNKIISGFLSLVIVRKLSHEHQRRSWTTSVSRQATTCSMRGNKDFFSDQRLVHQEISHWRTTDFAADSTSLNENFGFHFY